MEQTECSETSAYKIQTPGNYPEENIQHTEHGESLKSRTVPTCFNAPKIARIGAVVSSIEKVKPKNLCHVNA
jgi:hypothetical protein